jgi:hypothetical protein
MAWRSNHSWLRVLGDERLLAEGSKLVEHLAEVTFCMGSEGSRRDRELVPLDERGRSHA